ncbi:MAG TPA: HAD family hydrolase, partial [Bacteroidetes bacterium]|nr:HAD family hydrolase [Bacteroidota bacterium]HEX03670.1 HAD family hydrolase [Bacteroidota bacterium]
EDLVSGIGAPSDVFYRSLLDDAYLDKWKEFRDIIIEEEKSQLATERITFPGTINTLNTLSKRGYKMAMVSNCSTQYLQEVLDTQKLREYFDIATCIGDRDGATKTELVAEVVAKLGGKAAVIGDREYDVEAGKANGLPVVGALYGYGSREELIGTATWVEDVRHLIFLFNPARELAARIAAEINKYRHLDKPFVVALETMHEALSFPLSQHIFAELADINVPAAYFRLEDYRSKSLAKLDATEWFKRSYPWDSVNTLLTQRDQGQINMQLVRSDSETKPLRSRAGGVVLMEGPGLSGEWIQNSFDYHVRLNSKPATISRILRSMQSIERHKQLTGAGTVPVDLVDPTEALHEWKTSARQDALTAIVGQTESTPDMTIDGDQLEKGLIIS